MHKNKNEIMRISSCLVVIVILTSAVPVSVFAEKALDGCYTYEWYRIYSNGETYAINVVTKTPISNLDQNPISQTHPIETIYIVDGNGNLLTDYFLAKNLVIDAQSSARFINGMDSGSFTRSISPNDLYFEIRTDRSGNDYLVVGPAKTTDWWRDMFLYTDTILPPPLPSLKGLDNYDHRVEIWEGVILDAALQPDLYDHLEDNPQLQQDLRELHDALVFAEYDCTISKIILEGEGRFELKPREIQTTLNNWGKVSSHAKMMKHLDELGKAFAVAGVGVQILEITGNANRMLVLHTLANARAEERLDAIGEYIQANSDELDPALVEGYNNARDKFDYICERYYDEVGNLIRSAIQSDKLVDLGFTTASLYAVFKSAALGKVILPYYLSWNVYKGLRNKNEKVQRFTMAATLQRHLACQTTADGLETLQSDLDSSDPKNKDSIETAITLYNINQYLGRYFYRNYYEVLDDPVFKPIQDFFTGGQLSDYLDDLDFIASADRANCIQTQKPYLLTEFDFYRWYDYTWLINKLAYSYFIIIGRSEKYWYASGETAKVTVDIKNIGDKKNFWLGVSFKDPKGEFTKYYPQIIVTPQSASIDSCETKRFTVEWVIPDDAPLGQYEMAVTCWKDATFTEKYSDGIEWVPIFNVDIPPPIIDFNTILAAISDFFEAIISTLTEIVTSLKDKPISVPTEQKAIENVEKALGALSSMAGAYSEFLKMIYETSGVEPPDESEVRFNYHVSSSKFCENVDEARAYMNTEEIKNTDMNEAFKLIRELGLERTGFCIVIVDYSFIGFGEYESGRYPIVCNEKGDPYWESWQFYESINKEIEGGYDGYKGGA